MPKYTAIRLGLWGPKNADELIDGIHMWRNPGEQLAEDPGFCVIC